MQDIEATEAEETTDEVIDTPSQETVLMEAAKEYFIALSSQAAEYRELIDTAKTRTKKNVYKKKLDKINAEAIKVLAGIDHVSQLRESNASALEKIVKTELGSEHI